VVALHADRVCVARRRRSGQQPAAGAALPAQREITGPVGRREVRLNRDHVAVRVREVAGRTVPSVERDQSRSDGGRTGRVIGLTEISRQQGRRKSQKRAGLTVDRRATVDAGGAAIREAVVVER